MSCNCRHKMTGIIDPQAVKKQKAAQEAAKEKIEEARPKNKVRNKKEEIKEPEE